MWCDFRSISTDLPQLISWGAIEPQHGLLPCTGRTPLDVQRTCYASACASAHADSGTDCRPRRGCASGSPDTTGRRTDHNRAFDPHLPTRFTWIPSRSQEEDYDDDEEEDDSRADSGTDCSSHAKSDGSTD